EVIAQQVADQRLHLGVDGEQDVRPEIEQVAVDRGRARKTAHPILALVDLPMILPRALQRVGGGEARQAGSEDYVFAFAHGRALWSESFAGVKAQGRQAFPTTSAGGTRASSHRAVRGPALPAADCTAGRTGAAPDRAGPALRRGA